MRKGLPQQLEDEIFNAVLPIVRKYIGMKKRHMSFWRIFGIVSSAITRTRFQLYIESNGKK